jgi:hypothetical protein
MDEASIVSTWMLYTIFLWKFTPKYEYFTFSTKEISARYAQDNSQTFYVHKRNLWPGSRVFKILFFNVHTYLLTYLLTHSMEQSSSLEANKFSASQEIPRILWNPKVHYRNHKCHLSLSSIQVRGLLFVWKHDTFLRWGVVSTSPNPQYGGLPLLGCPRLLINIFAATLHIGGSSSIRNLRTRHAVVTGTYWSRQRPHYDPSIVYKEGKIVMWWL